MKRVIREKRRSVSENSPMRSAPSVAIISLSTRSFSSALASRRARRRTQADAPDEVAVAVERLVAVDPALGAPPVGAREDLEAGDVAPPPPSQRRCSPTLTRRSTSRPVTCTRAISSSSRRSRVHLQALPDLPPARQRVVAVEEARVDDLLPVLSASIPASAAIAGRAVEAERPSEAAFVLLLPAPVEQLAHRLAAAHDRGRVDRVERARVGGRDDRDLVVDFVDEAAHVARREVSSCASSATRRSHGRGSRRRRRRAGRRRSRGRPSATPRGSARRTAVARIRVRRSARRRPAHAAAASEREVDEHAGVSVEHLLGGA